MIAQTVSPTISPSSVNVKGFGAFGNGSSHPISGLATFNGSDVLGWTLGQWQANYPFITSLTDEADEVAILAAQNYALANNRQVYIPGGNYRANFTGVVSPSSGQTVSVTGDGPTTDISVTGNITFLAYTMPANANSAASEMLFKDFSVFQAAVASEGSAISITGPASGGDTPVANFVNMQFGQNNLAINTYGDFATSVVLLNMQQSNFINDKFYGVVNTSLGGPNSRNGTGVSSNGNSSQLAYGPSFVNCWWGAQNIGVLIGDGTNSYVQGVKITGGSFVAGNQLVKWHSSNTNQQNDYLSVIGVDIQPYGIGIDVDTVTTVNLLGNYFVGSNGAANATFVNIAETGNQVQIITISGNSFASDGAVQGGLVIAGTTGQRGVNVSGNLFFDFANVGQVPLALGSGSTNMVISGNVFCDDNVPTDGGTNFWSNTTWTKSFGTSHYYATGIPTGS